MKRTFARLRLVVSFMAAVFILLFQNCGPAKVTSNRSSILEGNSDLGSTGGLPTPTPMPSPTPTASPTPSATPTPTPTPSPTPISGASLVLSTTDIDFGSIGVFEFSAVRQVVVSNVGNNFVVLRKLTMPEYHRFEPGTCYPTPLNPYGTITGVVLAPGATCTINIGTRTGMPGQYTGWLELFTSESIFPYYYVKLTVSVL